MLDTFLDETIDLIHSVFPSKTMKNAGNAKKYSNERLFVKIEGFEPSPKYRITQGSKGFKLFSFSGCDFHTGSSPMLSGLFYHRSTSTKSFLITCDT